MSPPEDSDQAEIYVEVRRYMLQYYKKMFRMNLSKDVRVYSIRIISNNRANVEMWMVS